jgi:DNA-3-methyladenine glycosylase I
MPTASVQRHVYKRNPNSALTQKRLQLNKKQHSINKHENSIFPFFGIQRSNSNLSLSSLSLSQNSNDDSSIGSSICSWEQKVLSFRGILSAFGKNEFFDGGVEGDREEEHEETVEYDKRKEKDDIDEILNEYLDCQEPGSLKRCSWITKSSGKYLLTEILSRKENREKESWNQDAIKRYPATDAILFFINL